MCELFLSFFWRCYEIEQVALNTPSDFFVKNCALNMGHSAIEAMLEHELRSF